MSRWTSWLPSGSPGRAEPFAAPAELRELRGQVVAVLHDCQGPVADRLRSRVVRARTANDLWLSRSDIYQIIASQHCEGVALQRINGLVPAFEGHVPPRLLRAV